MHKLMAFGGIGLFAVGAVSGLLIILPSTPAAAITGAGVALYFLGIMLAPLPAKREEDIYDARASLLRKHYTSEQARERADRLEDALTGEVFTLERILLKHHVEGRKHLDAANGKMRFLLLKREAHTSEQDPFFLLAVLEEMQRDLRQAWGYAEQADLVTA